MIESKESNAAQVARTLRRLQLIGVTKKTLREQHGGTDWNGAVKCPVCGGIMQVRTAATGSVAGKCQTEGCVGFIE
jgi:hypothetical protein